MCKSADPTEYVLIESPDLIERLDDWRQWEKTGYNHDLLKQAITAIKILQKRVAELEGPT